MSLTGMEETQMFSSPEARNANLPMLTLGTMMLFNCFRSVGSVGGNASAA
jgi:hypothetical protein